MSSIPSSRDGLQLLKYSFKSYANTMKGDIGYQPPSLPPDKYTIGWISAIPTELTAAKAMLDVTHGPLKFQPKHDENNYTLGTIGAHNVVLACLGRYGTNDAAIAANSMKGTFPNLRFGLMVGVGGGIPSSDNDIRLGDIAVSYPSGQAGGVIQYDLGKEEDGVASLRAIPSLGKELTALVNAAFSDPDDDNDRRFPSNEPDVLFEETYFGEKVVKRKPRKSNDPRCFYGNLGSGNRVIKSADVRRRLAEEEGVIAFEMEAAGLMNSFNCIAIRGVCDYADSHKHKKWQPYAAAVAAAYAKRLLSVISTQAVEDLEPVNKNEHWIVPRQVTTHFTGRKEILQNMREQICKEDSSVQKRFIICGLGGSGKSEVCLKFVHDNRESFWGIFWIDASNEDSIKRDFVNVVKRAAGMKDVPYEEAKTWFENNDKSWLLIFDNADNESIDYFDFFPSGNYGCILMSTRIPDFAQYYSTVGCQDDDFEKLRLHESIELLLKCAGVPTQQWETAWADARQVIGDDVLSQHALAITQAGAFIKKGLATLKEYPTMYKKQRKQLLTYHQKQAKSRYGDVYATFEVSAEAMRNSQEQSWKDALELINVLAFFHREGVPQEIFVNSWIEAVELTQEEPCDDIDTCSSWHVIRMQRILRQMDSSALELDILSLRKARSALQSFSLVYVSPESGDISMHPLVHAWAKDRQPADMQSVARATAASVLSLSLQADFSHRDYLGRIQLHVQSCIYPSPEYLFESNKSHALEIDRILYAFSFAIDSVRNDNLTEIVTDILCSRIGHEIPLQSKNWRNVLYLKAICQQNLAKYKDSLNFFKLVVSYDKDHLSPESDDSLDALASLATAYVYLEKFPKAIKLHKQILKIRQKILAPEAHNYLVAQHWLGIAYAGDEQFQKAIKILKKVVRTRKETLAYTHPNRLAAEHELGRAYLTNKQFQKAIMILKRVVRTEKETLAYTHPHRLAAEHALGVAYLRDEQFQKAIKILKRVVRTQKETLAYTHPNRLASEHELGRAYLTDKQFQKAIKILKMVVRTQKEILAYTHPERLASEHELGRAYLLNEQFKKAIKILKRVVQTQKETLAYTHPDRLLSEQLLAEAYYENKEYRKALLIVKDVVAAHSEVSEPDNEDRVRAEDLLSDCLRLQRKRKRSDSDDDSSSHSSRDSEH